MDTLVSKQYKNTFVDNFTGDHSKNQQPRQTPGYLYALCNPSSVKKPKLLAWSHELAQEIEVKFPTTDAEIDVLAGNLVTESMKPFAACYAGHQFGNWAGQLGDGRAITLGEYVNSQNQSVELQLKGAGLTPYSRNADGRAVLRSSVREYLMSEAMYYLGVPTTRALSLVATGEPVLRDMFYNGNPAYEPGAIVMRVAPSFLRFGNFEMLSARNEIANLRKLSHWVIDKYYAHIPESEDRISIWFEEICDKSIEMVLHWMRVGFVHGVMNTDNMSILGLTIDYGPYSFLDDYDLNFTPNTTDLPGRRYAFGNQPFIIQWNLIRLANALVPLVQDSNTLLKSINTVKEKYLEGFYLMMSDKLGLEYNGDSDNELINEWLELIENLKADYTLVHRLLITLNLSVKDTNEIIKHFEASLYTQITHEQNVMLSEFILKYINRITQNKLDDSIRIAKMEESNPNFILRNYILHEVIEELQNGNPNKFQRLCEEIKNPYYNTSLDLMQKRPDWAQKKAGCSMLSCSS
ncbi:MAG: YdiU family protein [Cytophagales bacterium]